MIFGVCLIIPSDISVPTDSCLVSPRMSTQLFDRKCSPDLLIASQNILAPGMAILFIYWGQVLMPNLQAPIASQPSLLSEPHSLV